MLLKRVTIYYIVAAYNQDYTLMKMPPKKIINTNTL